MKNILLQESMSDWDFTSDEFWVDRNGKKDLRSILAVCGNISNYTEEELNTLNDYGKRITEDILTRWKQISGLNYMFVEKDEYGWKYRKKSFNSFTRLDSFEKLCSIFDQMLEKEV